MPRTVISPKKGIIMNKNQLGSFDPNAFSITMQDNEVRNKIVELFPYALDSGELNDLEEGVYAIADTISDLSAKERKDLRKSKDAIVERIAVLLSKGIQFEMVSGFADDPRFVKKAFSDSLEEAIAFVKDEFCPNSSDTDEDEKLYAGFDEKAIA